MENTTANEKSFLNILESSTKVIENIPESFNFSLSSISSKFGDIIQQNKKLPDLIKIGDYTSNSYENEIHKSSTIPALIPLSSENGICFYVNKKNKVEISNLKQSLILRILSSLFSELVKITCFYNDSYESDFPFLKNLDQKYFENKILSSSKEVSETLTNLSNLSLEFKQVLKKNNLKNIEEYNNKFFDKPYPYRFIIINNFPYGFDEKSSNQLLHLLENVANTGIHIIMSLDVSIKSPYSNETLEKLLSLMIGVYQENGNYFKLKNMNGDEKFFNEKFNLNLDTKIPTNLDNIIKNLNSKNKQRVDNVIQINSKHNLSVDFEDNSNLFDKIKNDSFITNDDYCDIFIGKNIIESSNSIFFRLRRQIESNLIIIGTDITSAVSIINISLFQIIKQSKSESKFYILDLFDVDEQSKGSFDFLKEFNKNIYIGETRNIENFIDQIIEEIESRTKNMENKDRIVLTVVNLQNARKKLEHKSSSILGQKLMRILSEGPELGIHSILYSQNYNSFENLIENKFFSEFENRLALNGGESEKILQNKSIDHINNGFGFLEFPYSISGFEKFKIYKFKATMSVNTNE